MHFSGALALLKITHSLVKYRNLKLLNYWAAANQAFWYNRSFPRHWDLASFPKVVMKNQQWNNECDAILQQNPLCLRK